MNTMTINGLKAVITFDEDTRMFHGEFLGLNGGADFYANSVDGLLEGAHHSMRFCRLVRKMALSRS